MAVPFSLQRSTIVAAMMLLLILIGSTGIAPAEAGPVFAGTCYAGCGALVTACFLAAGFTFGTVPGALIAATPALAGCNTAFGICEAACVAALVAPTL